MPGKPKTSCLSEAFNRAPILYEYPPANQRTVLNIANACLQNQKFYIKVCHLMNLLNLDPPFEEDFRNSTTLSNSGGIETISMN